MDNHQSEHVPYMSSDFINKPCHKNKKSVQQNKRDKLTVTVINNMWRRHMYVQCATTSHFSANTHKLNNLKCLQIYDVAPPFCFLLLQHSLCTVKLSVCQSDILNSCWNMTYRHIFKFCNFDFVQADICGLQRIDFKHLYTHITLKFHIHHVTRWDEKTSKLLSE